MNVKLKNKTKKKINKIKGKYFNIINYYLPVL